MFVKLKNILGLLRLYYNSAYTVKPSQTTTFIKRPLLFPRRFILYILTGFNDHLHNAINDRQNAFPNDHFNFCQRPLTLLHDELTTKMGKLTGDVPPKVTFIFRIHKPEVIFFVLKIMFSLLLSFLIKNVYFLFKYFCLFGIFVRI